MATNQLSETKRIQLDGIVQKMVANGESDQNIQTVVDDFKKRDDPFNPFPTKQIDPINWANPPDWIPGSQIGKAIGTQYAAHAPQAIGGAPDKAKKFVTPGPTAEQVGGDVLRSGALIGGLAAAPVTIPGTIAAGAGIGAAQSGGNAMVAKAPVGTVAKQASIGAAIGGVTAGAVSLFGKMLGSIGYKIQMTSIKPSARDIKDGFSLSTIKKYNLGGSLSTVYDKTEAQLGDLTQQLNEKLQGSEASTDLNNVYKQTVSDLSTQTNKAKTFGSNTSIENALAWLKGEINAVSPDGNVSIPQAQLIKQGVGRYGAWQYGVRDPESTARETVANAFYTHLKKTIEDNSPEGVREINQKLSELIPIANAVIRRIPVAERNNALGLNDMITLTASILDPKALIGFGISLAQKEGAVGNILSKMAPGVQRFAVPATLSTSAGASLLNKPGSATTTPPTQ